MNAPYYDEFSMEASELLDEAEDALLQIDKSSDIEKIYNSVFRVFHSLKGSSGMVGLFELQKHLHHLEDYLQKSKNNIELFKASVDFYLEGIDISRKMLQGEIIHFVKDNQISLPDCSTSYIEEKGDLKSDIIYLSKSPTQKLKNEVTEVARLLKCNVIFAKLDDYETLKTINEKYILIIIDECDILMSSGLLENLKIPLILILNNESLCLKNKKIFQILKTSDDSNRIFFVLQSALKAHKSSQLFEKAKGLLMFMYSDLEEYLIEKKKVKFQKELSDEIKNFIKYYSK